MDVLQNFDSYSESERNKLLSQIGGYRENNQIGGDDDTAVLKQIAGIIKEATTKAIGTKLSQFGEYKSKLEGISEINKKKIEAIKREI